MTTDNALAHYAQVIARDLDIDVINLAGGGAAGGMGAALYAFAVRSFVRGLRLSPMRCIWQSRWLTPIW